MISSTLYIRYFARGVLYEVLTVNSKKCPLLCSLHKENIMKHHTRQVGTKISHNLRQAFFVEACKNFASKKLAQLFSRLVWLDQHEKEATPIACFNYLETYITVFKCRGVFLEFPGKKEVSLQWLGSISLTKSLKLLEIYYTLRNSNLSTSLFFISRPESRAKPLKKTTQLPSSDWTFSQRTLHLFLLTGSYFLTPKVIASFFQTIL